MSDDFINQQDDLLVYLDDELQSMVIKADVEKRYILKRTPGGATVKIRGRVKILLNGEYAVRAEVDPWPRCSCPCKCRQG